MIKLFATSVRKMYGKLELIEKSRYAHFALAVVSWDPGWTFMPCVRSLFLLAISLRGVAADSSCALERAEPTGTIRPLV